VNHIEALGYVDRIQIVDSVLKYNINTNKNEFRNYPKSSYVTVVKFGEDIKPKLTEGTTFLTIFALLEDDVILSSIERTAIKLAYLRTESLTPTISSQSFIKLLWDVTEDLLVDPDMDATTPTIGGTISARADDNTIDPDMDATPSIAGTISARSDNSTVDPDMDATPSILQTLTLTDISFTATSTISTAAGDFTVFSDGDSITVSSTSTTNDGTYTISGAPTTSTITISETTLTTEDAATAGTVSISRTV
jgi:hypothetical protein